MNVIERIAAFVAPHDCVSCRAEGALLCADCTTSLKALPAQCYLCRQPSMDYLTCADCQQSSPILRAGVAVAYQDVAKDLVWRLKFAGGRAAASVMAARMLPLLPAQDDAVIVPVPTATGRARQRGYDQAKLLAHELSRQSRLPYRDLLARSGQAHQVGADRTTRLQQLAGAYRLKRRQPSAKMIVLIDDVITTGATIEAAAVTLAASGVINIQALAFARPHDKSNSQGKS